MKKICQNNKLLLRITERDVTVNRHCSPMKRSTMEHLIAMQKNEKTVDRGGTIEA